MRIKSIGLAVLCGLWFSLAQAGDIREGEHYQKLNTQASAVPEVINFFALSCWLCYQLEPDIKDWQQQHPGVRWRSVPIWDGDVMQVQAKAYFIARQLGKKKAATALFFRLIHEEKQPLDTMQVVQEQLLGLGIDKMKYKRIANGSRVKKDLRTASRLRARYPLKGAPSFIVNGRYLVDPTMVTSREGLFDVINQLLAR